MVFLSLRALVEAAVEVAPVSRRLHHGSSAPRRLTGGGRHPRSRSHPEHCRTKRRNPRRRIRCRPRPEIALEPLASTAVIAPLVMAAVSPAERPGVTNARAEARRASAPEQAPMQGADAGAAQVKVLGSGLGQGSGGGTGGGPYRPGSGIQPPKLLREVKAEYTEEARKRGLTGDVVLEIVIQRDGRVGSVTVKRGLGGGLDQRAIDAVRQWQFAPASRLGEAIDVIVEVSVQFTMR